MYANSTAALMIALGLHYIPVFLRAGLGRLGDVGNESDEPSWLPAVERNNERRLGLFALSQKPEWRRKRRRMGELDMDGRRRMEGEGRERQGEWR